MFEGLVRREGQRGGRAASVALATALHAAAIGIAAVLTTVATAPAAKDPDVRITFHPGRRGGPKAAQPSATPFKPAPRKPRRSAEQPVRQQKAPELKLRERVEKTIEIEAPAPAPQSALEPEQAADWGAPGDGEPGDGQPTGDGPGDAPGDGIGGPLQLGPAPSAEPIVEFTQHMSRPLPDGCRPPAPQMPDQARLAGIEGRVVARYVVHADGRVGEVRSLDPSSPPVLVEAVAAWLSRCQYRPALLQGRPVGVKMTQVFNFHVR